MFERQSRYFEIETATMELRGEDGATREVRFVRRRLLPAPASEEETVAEHLVVDGDRLDNVAARYLDDPLQFWRLCDANGVLHPLELTDEVGETIKIALPSL